jgi:hypothetical protein
LRSKNAAGISLVLFGHQLLLFLHGNGMDVTMQFPATLDTGSGIASHTVYGPKHMAIHNSAVSVGTRYILNCDGYVHAFTHHKNPSVGHLNGNPNNHGNGKYQAAVGHRLPGIFNTGRHLPSVSVSGDISKHQNRW